MTTIVSPSGYIITPHIFFEIIEKFAFEIWVGKRIVLYNTKHVVFMWVMAGVWSQSWLQLKQSAAHWYIDFFAVLSTQIVFGDIVFSWLSQRQLQMVYVSYNISISLWFHCPQHFLSDPGQITNASPSSSLFQRGIHPDMEYTWNHPARFLIHFKEGLFGLRLLNLKRGKLCSRQIELMNFIDVTKCSDKAWWWLCCLCSSSKALKR